MASITVQSKKLSEKDTTVLLKEMVTSFNENQSLQETIENLTLYEAKYGLSTVQFYPQFIAGKLGDSADFMLWATYYEAFVELTQPQIVARISA